MHDYDLVLITPEGTPFTYEKACRDKHGKIIKEERKDASGAARTSVKTEEADFTLGQAILTVTQNPIPGDETLPPMDIVNLGTSGIAVMRKQAISAEQVEVLKARISKFYSTNPLLVALIHEALDAPPGGTRSPRKPK
jgi:hypothetical protein